MIKYRNLLSCFVVSWAMLMFSLAQAQPAPQPEGPTDKEHVEHSIQAVFDQLNLTDDQKRQLADNKQQQHSKMETAHQAMKQARGDFQRELMKPDLDMGTINAIHTRIKGLQAQMEDLRFTSILTVRAILTREQFLKFVSLMNKHPQEHH